MNEVEELKIITQIDNFLSEVFKIIVDDVRKSPTTNEQWALVLAQAEQLKEGYRKDYETFQSLLPLCDDDEMDKAAAIDTSAGSRIMVPVSAIEFNVGGNTMWVQSNIGATTLRIKCSGKINVDRCASNPVSHSDMMISADINVCLSTEAKNG